MTTVVDRRPALLLWTDTASLPVWGQSGCSVWTKLVDGSCVRFDSVIQSVPDAPVLLEFSGAASEMVALTGAVKLQTAGPPGDTQEKLPFTVPFSVSLLVPPMLTVGRVPMQYGGTSQPPTLGADCTAAALQLKPLKPVLDENGLFEKHALPL